MSGASKVASVVGLLKVMVRVENPFRLMVPGLEALTSVGGTGSVGLTGLTTRVATAGAELSPLLVSKAPIPRLLM